MHSLYDTEARSFYAYFLEGFCHKRMLNFIEDIVCAYEMIKLFLFFSLFTCVLCSLCRLNTFMKLILLNGNRGKEEIQYK